MQKVLEFASPGVQLVRRLLWALQFNLVLNLDQCLPPCSAILTCEACALLQDCLSRAGTVSIYSTNLTEYVSTYLVKGSQLENHTNIHMTASVSESINKIVINFSMPPNMGGSAEGDSENVDSFCFLTSKPARIWMGSSLSSTLTLLSSHILHHSRSSKLYL